MKKEIKIDLPDDDKNMIQVKEIYGKTHKIEAVLGTHVTLDDLGPGQSICWGDGETFHFRLTKLSTINN